MVYAWIDGFCMWGIHVIKAASDSEDLERGTSP